jgi:hypothetical protein
MAHDSKISGYATTKKMSFTKTFSFSMDFPWTVLIRNTFVLVVLIENSAPDKNKFNYLRTTGNYLTILLDNQLIFAPSNVADISALRNVIKNIL